MKTVTISNKDNVYIDDEDYELVKKFRWSIRKSRNTYYAQTSAYFLNNQYIPPIKKEVIHLYRKRDSKGRFNKKRFYTHKRLTIFMHRLILNLPIKERLVDHINGNGLDNRKNNLRICTNTLNKANGKIYKNNTSGYKGVSWDKEAGKYKASISFNKKSRNLGRYKNPKQAARAYDKAAIKYFGEFANTNF